jgi:hypothetical protein
MGVEDGRGGTKAQKKKKAQVRVVGDQEPKKHAPTHREPKQLSLSPRLQPVPEFMAVFDQAF